MITLLAFNVPKQTALCCLNKATLIGFFKAHSRLDPNTQQKKLIAFSLLSSSLLDRFENRTDSLEIRIHIVDAVWNLIHVSSKNWVRVFYVQLPLAVFKVYRPCCCQFELPKHLKLHPLITLFIERRYLLRKENIC